MRARESEPIRSGAPSPSTAQAGDSSNAAEKSARRRILIVDDEPLIRWWLAETFSSRNCDIVEASDARSAVAALHDGGPFDAILLDFRLPDSNDLTLLAHLHALSPAARIVLMTAFGTPEIRRRALEVGADSVVTKPFQIDEVAGVLFAD
jgi:DNA-binding response OmpR family regulator